MPVVFFHKKNHHCLFPYFLVPPTVNSGSQQGLRSLEMTNGERKLVSSCTEGCSRLLSSVLGSPDHLSRASVEDTRTTRQLQTLFITSVSLGQVLAALALCEPCGLLARAARRPLPYVPTCKARAVTLCLCPALPCGLPKLGL